MAKKEQQTAWRFDNRTFQERYCGKPTSVRQVGDYDKDLLMRFMWWLDKRGFIKDDLQFDTMHQVETFLSMYSRNDI